MQCIFCLQEREPSVEHVYPDAIGGTLIIHRVCKPCNDWLGTNVDVLLTDHVAILAKRNQLRIPNRSGEVPTWHDVHGLGTMANDPNQRVKIVEDAKTGKIKPTLLHKEVRTKPDNGAAGINVTIDASQVAAIGKIIERSRKREGLPPLSKAELQEQIEAVEAEIGTIEYPEVIHKLTVDLWQYQRPICKIIYELAWHWLGDAYLDDLIAHKLRNFILHATVEEIRNRIQLGANTAPFDPLWKMEPNAHIGLCMRAGPTIFVGVRVFDAMCGVVSITENPDKYPNFSNGTFFCCDPQTGETRSTTLSEEVTRLSRRSHGS